MTRDELLAAYAEGKRDFRWANLRGADLGGANLREANLSGADLRGANLSWANLGGANLRGADLRGANLSWANLGGANLREADLGGANLRGANLGGAKLAEANLRGADLSGANLRKANLRGSLASMGLEPDPALPGQIVDAIAAIPESWDQNVWHSSCGTKHCIAGYAVHLSGRLGKMLETQLGTQTAATLLLWRDGAELPSFATDASEDETLGRLRKMAEQAKAD